MYLMAADDEVHIISVAEGTGDVRAELNAHTALGGRASRRIHGVRPEQLAHQPAVRRLAVSLQCSQILQTHIV